MLKGTTEGLQSRIAELACIVASKTAEIDGFLAMKDLPLPSFDTEAPLDLHLSEDLEAARNLVIDANAELKELLLGPMKGAQVYFFRWILHNWSDRYCLNILQNLVTALEPGAQILINDTCLPEPGTVPWRPESTIRTLYLAMLQIQNFRERDEHDWKRLLKQADEGYRFQRVIRPLGSVLAIILAVWDYEVM